MAGATTRLFFIVLAARSVSGETNARLLGDAQAMLKDSLNRLRRVYSSDVMGQNSQKVNQGYSSGSVVAYNQRNAAENAHMPVTTAALHSTESLAKGLLNSLSESHGRKLVVKDLEDQDLAKSGQNALAKLRGTFGPKLFEEGEEKWSVMSHKSLEATAPDVQEESSFEMNKSARILVIGASAGLVAVAIVFGAFRIFHVAKHNQPAVYDRYVPEDASISSRAGLLNGESAE